MQRGEARARLRMPDGLTPHETSRPVSLAKPVVLVVDDDISVRESLESLLCQEGWEAKTFSSADEFLNHPPTLAPSCLILDVSLPGTSGLELQRRIAGERAEMPIIFITGHGDIPMTVQAIKAGAIEFLTKPFTDDALVNAIRQALEHSRAALNDQHATREMRDRYATLSRRELEVMALVTTGMLNKQVAAELGISEITVKVHRGRIMQKMKAGSLADLVKISLILGLERRGALQA